MNRIHNAEEVLELLLTQISLGSYDKRFLHSLQVTNILSRKPITTNQAALFKKVLLKYHKQFTKYEYDVAALAALPWSTKIIPSASEFTVPNIKIDSDNIILRSPYKDSFVKEFRALGVMQWHQTEKYYYAEFGLRSLKLIVDMVRKHYTEFTCCDTITGILNEVSLYENCKYWEPTLTRINGRLYIVATSEQLDTALKHLELSTDWSTIAKLAACGVAIDPQLQQEIAPDANDTDTVTKLSFAANTNIQHNIHNMDELALLLKSVECDYVLYLNPYSNYVSAEPVEHMLAELGIAHNTNTIRTVKETTANELLSRNHQMPILIQLGTVDFEHAGGKFAGKIVSLTDNTPIGY